MTTDWAATQAAFDDAAVWFVAVAGRVGGRWSEPGLGEWDVRALVGHTAEALLTVEKYAARPATEVAADSPAAYFRAALVHADGPEVVEEGRQAGAALGPDPVAAVAGIAERVRRLLGTLSPDDLVTTYVGGMRLGDYLPTRTFELAVHTADLAAALGEPLDVPGRAAREALAIAGELAVSGGSAGVLLLAATGRDTGSFSVL